MNIYIRADGGKSIGMGHVMRMLVLAKQLKKKNEVIFLCKNDKSDTYNAGIEKIRESGFEVIEIDSCNVVENIISIQNKNKADILITDSYDVEPEYFDKLKKMFSVSGYVDDVNKCYMNVDFLINQNINAKYMNYSKTTSGYTKLFLGPKYSMIRDEFRISETNDISKRENVEDILLTLGGMDCDGNTLKILYMMTGITQKIHVVIGSAFDKKVKNNIYDYAKKHKNIYLYENANMAELMSKCDIAVSACGSTLYELCAMKVPTIGIILADNQKESGTLMQKEKLIFSIFSIEDIKYKDFFTSVNRLIDNRGIRDEIKENCNNVVNLYGSNILSEAIEKIFESRSMRKYD